MNKYEAYWRWERGEDGTYYFDCIEPSFVQCIDCPLYTTPLNCTKITEGVPDWNAVRKLVEEAYDNG